MHEEMAVAGVGIEVKRDYVLYDLCFEVDDSL
jgi:hypothetical protein